MLPSLRHSLCIESSGEDAPFNLAASACTARGIERSGIAEVVAADGRRLTGPCHVRESSCTRFRITPLGIERELHVGATRVTERTVVCPSEAAFAIEWQADDDVTLDLALDDLAGDMTLQGSGVVAGRISITAQEPALLVVRAHASRAGDPHTWVRAHQAAEARRATELVRAELPSRRLSDAVAWAEFRLSSVSALHVGGDDWADFAAGQSESANRRWQQLALRCFEGEKGAWPAQHGASAGDVITGLVAGMVGMRADAERERLRLRPQFPVDFDRALIRNLRTGDAQVDLEFTRLEAALRFAVTQVAGAYPLRLIFEPALPRVPRRITVDGHAAELDLAPFGERVVAPVQIMLDERRVLEFGF